MKRVLIHLFVLVFVVNSGLFVGGCSEESSETSSHTNSKSACDKIYKSVDQMPKQINDVFVNYPKDALEAKIEGVVQVKMLLGIDGTVEDAEVSVSSGHPNLDKAAIDAAKQIKYSPGMVDGEPVCMWLYRPFHFKPDKVNK